MVNAQDACVKFFAKEQNSFVSNEAVKIMLISNGDSLLGVNNDQGEICFRLKAFADKPIDVLVEVHGKKMIYPSLYPAFLKLSENQPKWVLTIDKSPFDKKKYPRINKWNNVDVIETFEVSSRDSEDAAIFYKRRKDGSFID